MLNKVQLIGRLGSQPEMKVYENNKRMAWVDIATDSFYVAKDGTKQKKTIWHRLIFYGGLADFIYEKLTKGKLLYVEGRLDYWGKEKNAVIIVDTLKILSPKKKLAEPYPAIQDPFAEQEAIITEAEEMIEDIPF